jgi:hypothetical protein
MRAMELDSIECVSYTDGMDDDDPAAPAQLPRPFLKSPATAGAVVASDSGGGAGAGPLVPPATGVHELLECPVCTNSMYPPIHQVRFISCSPFRGDPLRDPVPAIWDLGGCPCVGSWFQGWLGRRYHPAQPLCQTQKHGAVIRTLEFKTKLLLLQLVLVLTPGLAA